MADKVQPRGYPVAAQTLIISAVQANSVELSESTTAVRLHATATCFVQFSNVTSPGVTTDGSDAVILSNQVEEFDTEGSKFISVKALAGGVGGLLYITELRRGNERR